MVAAPAKMTPARFNPWPPEPENRISYRPLISLPPRLFLFLQALDHREVGIGKLRSLSLVENPRGKLAGGLFGRGLFEGRSGKRRILHPYKHVLGAPELVPAPVGRGTGVDDLEHRQPLLFHGADDQPVEGRDVVRRPP